MSGINERLAHKLATEYWEYAHNEVQGDYSPSLFAINLEHKLAQFLKQKKKEAGFLQSIIISLIARMVLNLLLEWILDGITQPPPYKETKK